MNHTKSDRTTSGKSSPPPPYNPWQSCLVEASAGSGKTWQLSRRFLALVVAGADPSSILTVTFNKKAAAEMRERIVKDAIALGAGSEEFKNFVSDIQTWQQDSDRGETVHIRSAEEASRLIIQKTQTLKITTIDALFMQWSQRFPLETSVTIHDISLKSPWNLLSNLEQTRLETAAWGDVLATNPDDAANRELMISISQNAPNRKIKSLTAAINPLTKSDTFLWYIKMLERDHPLKLYPVPEIIETDSEFLDRNDDLFRAVIQLASNKDKKTEGLVQLDLRNMDGLVAQAILKKGAHTLHGNTFKSKATIENPNFLELKSELETWMTHRQLSNLNHTAKLIWLLYGARTAAAHKRKVADSKGSFVDATKGASVLACDPAMVGGRAMAWSTIRHLMLDEFQDTSRLQWLIFEQIALDLLAGQIIDEEVGPSPSVFIVGDKKQSIYRFREAAPEVFDLAKEKLETFGLVAHGMNASYRSSSMILDFVNCVFEDGKNIADFPAHEAAPHLVKSAKIKSTYGTVTVYNVNEKYQEPNKLPVTCSEAEAETVAKHIRSCLDGIIPMRVFDSNLKGWRAPHYSDFLILYSASTHSQLFEDALRSRGIPCRREEAKGFFQRCETLDLNALVTWLTWPADTIALCTVLRSPIIGLTDRDLQDLVRTYPTNIYSEGLKTQYPSEWELLEDLKGSHLQETLAGLVGRLLSKYGVGDRYERAFGPLDGPLAKANVLKWFDLVRGASGDDALATHTWNLALEEAGEENEIGNATLASNSVTMMTIHKSKGLEFPCVIVTGTAGDWHKSETGWIKDVRVGEEGMWYVGKKDDQPTASLELTEILSLSERESRAEKARLLYVALTRASHHLVITGSRRALNPKNPVPETFLDHLKLASKKLEDVTTTALGEVGLIVTRGVHPDVSKEIVIPRKPDYLLNPVKALGLAGIKILTPSSASMTWASSKSGITSPTEPSSLIHRVPDGAGKAFGTVVHKLLENQIKKTTWSDDRLARLLASEATEPLSDKEILQVLALAKSDVSALLASATWTKLMANAKSVLSEVPMAHITGETMINAKADLIIVSSDGPIKVVDYKTIPFEGGDASKFCAEHGYTQQVKDYCDIAKKSFAIANVSGYVLFTNPILLVQVT